VIILRLDGRRFLVHLVGSSSSEWCCAAAPDPCQVAEAALGNRAPEANYPSERQRMFLKAM